MKTRIALASLALTLSATLAPAIAHADPFDQRDFPCQEDEVLGYAPRFGPDRVGCIHIEEFTVVEHGVAAADGGVPGNADLTYCPSDDTWSLEWHECP